MVKSKVSFVLPVYNEEAVLPEFYKVLCTQLKKHAKKYDFEILFINDGSRDGSFAELQKLQTQDKQVRVVNFARNFGHQAAITAGLDFATGDAVIIMDTDLQDPPAVAFELVETWRKGYQVVYAKRKTRQDGAFKRATAFGFYWLIDQLTKFELPRNVGDFRLMDRKVVNTVNTFREHNRFMRGIVAYVGFRQTAVLFDRDARFAGETKYPLRKMIKLALDGIFSFSTFPLKLITQVGLLASFLSFVGIIYTIAMYFVRPEITVPGWTLMMIAVLFMGGIQMIMLGILGEYVGRIYAEVQNRPLYIVDEVWE
jgi:glycosyltransferase involved in cell wall biosynthesis